MSRKPSFAPALMVLFVVTLASGFHVCSVKADEWVHYVPGEDETSFDYSKSNGTSYVNISIHFWSSGFNVSDWGNPTIVGANISVDAEVWMWTGISFPLDMWLQHQYNLGNLTPGQYLFSFTVWTYPVRDITFNVPMVVPDDYPTIQEAINHANDGDTASVRNGIYHENVVVNKSISLIGENRDTTFIDGNGTGTVVSVLSSNVHIRGFHIGNSLDREGIDLYSVIGCNISDNIVVNSYIGINVEYSRECVSNDNVLTEDNSGIRLYFSSDCVVHDNVINQQSYGIELHGSGRNSISNNTLNNITSSGIGIWQSNNNSATTNLINKSRTGLILGDGAADNFVLRNNVSETELGIQVQYKTNHNVLYHNNLINNTDQVEIDSESLNNSWDKGYPSGGNYWSDYNYTDLFTGPYQNEPGGDGMGDTPYVIDENNSDLYPLISPWVPPDVAVLNMTSSKTIVGQGYSVNLNTTMQNQGSKVEELNATFYANETLIECQTFLLRSGDSIIYAHDWNSAALAKGNYTVSVHVESIEGETDLADNSLYDGWILVTIPGDLSGDFTVNILDAILLAGCFSSVPGSHHWNPNTDINSDGIVDIFDAIIIAGHYNQHYP